MHRLFTFDCQLNVPPNQELFIIHKCVFKPRVFFNHHIHISMKTFITSLIIMITFMGLVQELSAQLPENFPGYSVVSNENADEGYTFLSVSTEVEGVGFYVFIIDTAGEVYKYRELNHDYAYDFKMQPNGQLSYAQFTSHHTYTGGGNCVHMIMDQEMNLMDSIGLQNGYFAEAHDFQILPNGHILMFGYYLTQMDLSDVVDGGYPDAQVSGGIIQELDAEGNVIFQWRSWDHYNPETFIWGARSNLQVVSTFHLNDINLDTDGNIIFATPTWTKKLSRQTGEIMWHLGGDENEFSFIGIDSTDGVGMVAGHMFYRLDNGHVLLYDNSPRGGADANSKANEFILDEVNKTAELVWTYAYPTQIKGWHRGNAFRTNNGNTLIGWGGANGAQIPTCTEVDPDGNITYEVYFENPDVESYRAFKFPMGDGLIAEQTEIDLAQGNTYSFLQGDTLDTGIQVKVNVLGGIGYNEFTVAAYDKAPIKPAFAGKDPMLLPQRITMFPDWMSIEGTASFDVNILQINNPEQITVYARNFEEQGVFEPLTTSYNFVTGKLSANFTITDSDKFEFVFGYPDLTVFALKPWLETPINGSRMNENETIKLEWAPNGFFKYFTLQVATDESFSNLVVDESNYSPTFYNFSCEPQNDYYWRVKTFSEASDQILESEWSEVGHFQSTGEFIEMLAPLGGEKWQYGLDYFIRWNDNISDEVIIELYNEHTYLATLDTVESDGAYLWSIPTNTEIGCKYTIQVKDLATQTLLGESPAFFSITDTTGNDGCSDYIAETSNLNKLTVYPVPAHDQLTINFTLKSSANTVFEVLSIQGSKLLKPISKESSVGSNQTTLSIGSLSTGVYLMKIDIENETVYQKFIVN